ncbi:MAG: hypothetical protein GC190_12910 [Alphaproteobacteria bacterium]|nr:hypothetical protein [Alphaproteobacteria bacterium]
MKSSRFIVVFGSVIACQAAYASVALAAEGYCPVDVVGLSDCVDEPVLRKVTESNGYVQYYAKFTNRCHQTVRITVWDTTGQGTSNPGGVEGDGKTWEVRCQQSPDGGGCHGFDHFRVDC